MTSTERNNSQTILAFQDIILKSVQHRTQAPLPAMTFWCGAGFSKAWDKESPTDGDLFNIDLNEINDFPNLQHVIHVMGWDSYGHLDFERFKSLRYTLDMQLRYPDIRNRYFDDQNLTLSINELRTLVVKKFTSICNLNYIDNKSMTFYQNRSNDAQKNITNFFSLLEKTRHSEMDFSSWQPCHFLSTNYDFTIETIIQNIYTPQSSMLGRLYRGVTPNQVCGSNQAWPYLSRTFDRILLKINGGFEIVPATNGYEIDYSLRGDAAIQERPPLLILPSDVQDYDDHYFQQIFPKAVRLLRETNVLVIVGYSMPPEDALLRFILRQFAESPNDAIGKYVFVIDTKNHQTIKHRLQEIFFYTSYSEWPKQYYYSGKFESFCKNIF